MYDEDVRIFKAFCDEGRLKILEMLCEGEKCACVLLEKLDICQSTLSYHMKILCDSGVVNCRQEGKWTHYGINPEGCRHARERLEELTVNCVTDLEDTCCYTEPAELKP